MSTTATITSKGQLTLPKEVRRVLDTNTVEIEVIDGEVRLKPVRDVAGALARYAHKDAPPLHEIREKVWEDVAYGKKR
jgi:AbrB family looped-hinge helix DNA binding protein